ncbi:hypothetical protein [Symmachiella dynata]|uniref:hypothetical protein n=1 Tax=Symmachiella dynata TaxID=2527995 RepID=UPI0030EE5F69
MSLSFVVGNSTIWLFAGGFALLVVVLVVQRIFNPSRELEKQKCPGCSRAIARIADFCPDCGKPWPFGKT